MFNEQKRLNIHLIVKGKILMDMDTCTIINEFETRSKRISYMYMFVYTLCSSSMIFRVIAPQ
jgi:hypothetical protein